MTQVSQTPVYYWGEGGEYGPFSVQQEGAWAGWPNFGQVMRYFRKKAKLSGKEFGERYGKMVNCDGSAIGKRWIYDMETNNLGPVDFGRRKIIAELLNIPPILFGLAVLEDNTPITDPPKSYPVIVSQSTLKRIATDIDKYQADIRLRWQLYATSDAGYTIVAIEADVQRLEQLETQAQGDFLYHLQRLLFSNYYLAACINDDKMQYDKCYAYANKAVRVAKAMKGDPELVATAHWIRGSARLSWGSYATINEKGIFVVDHKLLGDALRDFEKAKTGAHPQLLGLIMTDLSLAQAHLRMKNALLTSLGVAAEQIGTNNINDPYERILVTATSSGFHKARFLARKAETENAAGLASEALKDIKQLRQLNENTYGVDETRRFAWIDILEARSHLLSGDFYKATDYAKKALRVVQALRIVSNIALITDLHGRLLSSPYGQSTDVEELGAMLVKGMI